MLRTRPNGDSFRRKKFVAQSAWRESKIVSRFKNGIERVPLAKPLDALQILDFGI